MKKYTLFINKFAEEDLENSKKYYDNQQQGLGSDFLLEIKEVVLRIEKNPYQFSVIDKKARKVSLKRFPFAIFFVVEDNLINVFSIFHFSRNPDVWRKRIDL